MLVRRPAFPRLVVFAAASLTLHALMVTGFAPSGARSAGYAPPGNHGVLHALLAPGAHPSSSLTTGIVEPEAQPSTAAEKVPATMHASVTSARSAATGLDLPVPSTWHTPAELDLRAEPLSAVHLQYPHEIAGGLPGRVRLRLYIDERGVVVKTQIAAAQPGGLFEDTAIRAWQDVRFSPAMKNGIAVKSQKLLELDFLPF